MLAASSLGQGGWSRLFRLGKVGETLTGSHHLLVRGSIIVTADHAPITAAAHLLSKL